MPDAVLGLHEVTEDELDKRLAAAVSAPFLADATCRLRADLFRFAPEGTVLLLVVDHVAMDAPSVPLLLRDLGDAYAAALDGVAADGAAPVDGCFAYIRGQGVPTPVDRRKTGNKHHLICDGRGTPLHVITTAANVNDITQTLHLVDGVPPVAGRRGRPRRRPEALLGDKEYDSQAVREQLRARRIQPVISSGGAPNIKGLGKLHQFKHLAVRWERRVELHNAPISLACGLICWRHLNKTRS